MEPSFLTLLKRGNYHHGKPIIHTSIIAGDIERNKKEYQEAERFAVAAIAFGLKHDPAFRIHFFEKICQIDGDPALVKRSATIEVEPHHWTDLVIRHRAGDVDYVYAVEFKIDAPLDDHQNPDEDAFWKDKNGYGKILSEREPDAEIRYIVLGHREKLKLTKRHRDVPVTPKQRCWSDLELSYEPKTNITDDLFDSLGKLGIPEFSHRKTNKMKITDSLASGAQAWEILRDVHQMVGLVPDRCLFYTGSKKPDGYEFGFSIVKKPPVQGKSENHQKLQDLVNTKSQELGWYGYTEGPAKKPKLSVWFYCDKQNNAKKIEERLRQKSFPQATTSPGEESGSHYVEVSTMKPGKSDRDWFISVFKALRLAQV